MKLAVVVLWALIAWPTLSLPWSTCDDPNTFVIAAKIERAPPLARPLVANAVGAESYPGRFMPLFWIWLWGTWKVLGAAALPHRVLHALAFLGLAGWVYRAVARAGAAPPRAALAAMGFLIFPAHYDLWPELQPVEPWQALAAAGFVESLVAGRAWTAALALLVCLALKETSLCLGLPLLVASGRGGRRFAPVWGVYGLWLALFLAFRPGASGEAWVAHYRPTPATCLATLAAIAAALWKASAVLPLAAAGALKVQGALADRLRVALAAAWALGGVIVFLPWSQLGPRHYLWFSAPLAVVIGAGCARAGRLAGAVAALCVAWMAAQFAATATMSLERRGVAERSFWAVLDGVAPLLAPGGRVVDGSAGTAGIMVGYMRACRGMDVTEAPLAHVRAGDVVVTDGAVPAGALALVYTLENRVIERELPEPRYALSLARRALAGERGPDGSLLGLLVPAQWERRVRYVVLVPR